MSGMRVGYLISSKHIVSTINQLRPLYEINHIAAHIFLNSLKNISEMRKSVNRLQEGKKFFLKETKKIGFNSLKSYANFVHVDFGKKRLKILKSLKSVLYCRDLEKHKSMKNFTRISLTSKNNFKIIIAKIRKSI